MLSITEGIVKRSSTMVVHFGFLRVTDAVTLDNTRNPTSFISHGRWPGCKLLEDNIADIEKREQEEDEVTMEVITSSDSSQRILRNFLFSKYSSLKWSWNRYFVKLCCNNLITTFFAVEENLIPFKYWTILRVGFFTKNFNFKSNPLGMPGHSPAG